MELKDIQTPADVLTYVRENDTQNYLSDLELNPVEAFSYLIANYDFGEDQSFTVESVTAQKEMLERVFAPGELVFSKDCDGLSFTDVKSMYESCAEYFYNLTHGTESDYRRMLEVISIVFEIPEPTYFYADVADFK